MLQVRSIMVRALLACALATLLTACGSSGSHDSTSSKQATGGAGRARPRPDKAGSVTAPAAIVAARSITFCSDVSYPPEEFYNGTRVAGSDADIAREVARLFGVEARFRNAPFDSVIPDLVAKKCDAVISGMSITPERSKQVAFVPYLQVGQSLMVRHGDAGSVTSIDDLVGKRIAVESDTTNLKYLQGVRDRQPAGKRIAVEPFTKDTEAVNALKAHVVDAYFGDSPVAAYYIGQDPHSFSFAGKAINAGPIGIALRPGDAQLQAAVRQAIHRMYATHTMDTLLAKWQLDDFALAGA